MSVNKIPPALLDYYTTKNFGTSGRLGVSAAGLYCPLMLQFNGWPKSKRNWTLRFQQSPIKEITLEGDEPTKDEIIECLRHTQAPIWLIEVLEVAAAVASRPTGKKPAQQPEGGRP